ncbi:MAG TPA: diadenylate cyclase, partial [Oligoflexia bacterium]|nr:diadenylate cyclase [Oligoflexia bacterium]
MVEHAIPEWLMMVKAFVEWSLLDWRDFLRLCADVIVVFALIYGLLVLVRGTRAERMLIGLGVIAFANIVARELHLSVLHWILQNFLNSVIVVVIIVFQDDFRRALTKVGLIPGFGSDTSGAHEKTVRAVARAAAELSSRRIGGLIVVRRDVGLDDYYEQSVPIDAVVSHQLLVSIFLPTSPLHDGAVFVEGDRIVSAGAVLPLSFNPAISSSFGTRHRAAIG